MIGKADRRFRKSFENLPQSVQKLAREKYALWKRDPYHPSLQFEERRNGICVVRIGEHYRLVLDRHTRAIQSFPLLIVQPIRGGAAKPCERYSWFVSIRVHSWFESFLFPCGSTVHT